MPVTEFQQKVYRECKKVPKGRVTTYKAIADALHSSPRAVGQALKRNPFAPEVPCHRVIKADGNIGGFSGQTDPKSKEIKKKVQLLKKEGVISKENTIIELDKIV